MNENFTGTHVIVTPQPITRCNCTCFQKDFYQQKQNQYPSYIYHPVYPMPSTIVQPSSIMPFNCNPSFNYPFHEPSYSQKITTKQKFLNPSSYRVTVRRITPSHVAAAAAEVYRVQRNKDSERIHFEEFNQTITTNHQQFRTTPIANIFEKDYLNSDNQNIPSVPSKKIVPKNDGIRVSSTSFITTTDDQKSFISDSISEKSNEYSMMHARTFNELSFSTEEVEKSNDDTFALSESISALQNTNVIDPELSHNQITTSRNEDIVTKISDNDISNENQITKQIESKRNSIIEEHSSIPPQPTIDKVEKHEWHPIKEEFSLLEISHHDTPNKLNSNTPESTIKTPSIDTSHPPTLPSSSPPNIDNIKSNEMLVYSSRSIKSITSLTNEKQKSSTDIRKSSLPLRTTRSTLDFGLMIDEIIT